MIARWAGVGLLAMGATAGIAFGVHHIRGKPADLTEDRGQLSETVLRRELPPLGEPADRYHHALVRHLHKRPGDSRAWVLRARLDMQAGRFAAAVAGYQTALAGQSTVLNDASVWVECAEALGMQQGRTLRGEPERLLQKALQIDSQHLQALDLAGSAAVETQDYAGALAHWQRLLPLLPQDSERHAQLKLAIVHAQQRSRFALPPRP